MDGSAFRSVGKLRWVPVGFLIAVGSCGTCVAQKACSGVQLKIERSSRTLKPDTLTWLGLRALPFR